VWICIVGDTFPPVAPDDLTSAAVPPVGAGDHLRGPAGEALLLYADFACPRCAVAWGRLAGRPLAFRHFALEAKDPRSVPLARAAQAAAAQGAFWAFADALFADPGHTDDPHLWARAEALGLDLDRFEADRRGEASLEAARRQTREGIRAGIVTTPAVFGPGAPPAPLDSAAY
jgi:protein-disulfide isomerase